VSKPDDLTLAGLFLVDIEPTQVERTGVGKALTRTHLGVSDRCWLRETPWFLRSIRPEQATSSRIGLGVSDRRV